MCSVIDTALAGWFPQDWQALGPIEGAIAQVVDAGPSFALLRVLRSTEGPLTDQWCADIEQS